LGNFPYSVGYLAQAFSPILKLPDLAPCVA
jgi:hypothetical protein